MGCPCRQKMIEDNLPLVGYALQLLEYDKTKYEDYFQQGCLELIRCVDNFNPEKGTNFSTYAVTSIKWFLKEYIQRDYIIKPKAIKNSGGAVEKVFCDSLDRVINNDGEDNEITLRDTYPIEDDYEIEESDIEWCLRKLHLDKIITKDEYEAYKLYIIDQDKITYVAEDYKIGRNKLRMRINEITELLKESYKLQFPDKYSSFISYNKSKED